MHIETITPFEYEIRSSEALLWSVLTYKRGETGVATFRGLAAGTILYQNQQWIFMPPSGSYDPIAKIAINHHTTMYLKLLHTREKYLFKRMSFWKTRFVLMNEQEDEEVLALIPKVNWHKRGYDFTVQVNEDFNSLITPLLLVVCLHCANSSLKIMNGDYPFTPYQAHE